MVKVFSRAALPYWTFTLFLAVVLTSPGKAQTALSSEQVSTFERLVREAVTNDGPYLSALVDLETAKVASSPLSAVNASAGFSVTGDFEQFQSPSYRLGLSVDLARLFSSGNGAAQKSLEARVNAARGQVRVKVLSAYTGYLYQRQEVQGASDGLEAKDAEQKQMQAKAQVGAATGADVLRAADARGQAKLAVYRANLDLVNRKQELAAIVGVELKELNAILKGGD